MRICKKVKDIDNREKAFRTTFEPSKVKQKRKFFNINQEQAIAVLSLPSVSIIKSTKNLSCLLEYQYSLNYIFLLIL
tara:strand:+ start:382 stop:612 length:231 start_codon:yes stop_codon:yes gene_type:complete